MSRKKLGSRAHKDALRRLSNLKAISPDLDLSETLSVPSYEQMINKFQEKLTQYNSLLATLDALRAEIKVDESTLKDVSEQMLMGVACKFGKNSFEYVKAGGVRKSDRKRPSKKAVALDSPTEAPQPT